MHPSDNESHETRRINQGTKHRERNSRMGPKLGLPSLRGQVEGKDWSKGTARREKCGKRKARSILQAKEHALSKRDNFIGRMKMRRRQEKRNEDW